MVVWISWINQVFTVKNIKIYIFIFPKKLQKIVELWVYKHIDFLVGIID